MSEIDWEDMRAEYIADDPDFKSLSERKQDDKIKQGLKDFKCVSRQYWRGHKKALQKRKSTKP